MHAPGCVLPSTRHSKCFCATCGSALPYEELEGAWLVVAAGSLDCDVTLKPDAHIFGSSRENWDKSDTPACKQSLAVYWRKASFRRWPMALLLLFLQLSINGC
jgi:hypothetical protein